MINTTNTKDSTEQKEKQMAIQLPVDLRDYLAAKAMQTQSWTFYLGDYETRKSLSNTAKNCYEIADAMMKAREA